MIHYEILYPIPGSVNGRGMVDPNFPGDLEAAEYETVVNGHWGAEAASDKEAADMLFALYQNEDMTGSGQNIGIGRLLRSMSVGDIVIVRRLGGCKRTAFLCESVGWREISGSEFEWKDGSQVGRIAKARATVALKKAKGQLYRHALELGAYGIETDQINAMVEDLERMQQALGA